MVSVIIPNYNRSKYLQECLFSIINQTVSNWEAIVVDDGSTDDSIEVLKSFTRQDTRIRLIQRNRDPKGAAASRNIGIDNAQGDYIIFLDSDDILAPHCLQQRIQVMKENPNLDFAVFKMQFFKEKPGDDSRVWNIETKEDTLQRFLNLDAVWQTSGPIWKKTALKKIGGFDEVLHCWQDIDIHLKALINSLQYEIRYDLSVDCFYRKNAEGTISQTNTNSPEKLASKSKLIDWVLAQKLPRIYHVEQLVNSVIISSINSYNQKFYRDLFEKYRTFLPKENIRKIQRMAAIQFSRLTKLNVFRKHYQKWSKQLVSPSSIGKYHESAT
jgi:glycosyltransferase involved in cell wall biosynthesis